MARIRTIKPEFWTSEKIVVCSRDARLFFIGMWNFADDAGRLSNSPIQLKMKIFPAEDLTLETIQGFITELSVNKLIDCYSIENKQYIQILGWDHQKINRANESKIPPKSETTHGVITESHLPEGKGKGREGKGIVNSVSDYFFEGKVIRLTTKDYDLWKKAYHAIPDFDAQLKSADDWISGEGEDAKKRWFHVISASLANKHQKYSKDAKVSDEDWLV